MGTPTRSSAAKIAAAALAVGALAGCYSPSIKNGGFRCNTEYEEQYACPEGYVCSNSFCVKPGTVADGGSESIADARLPDGSTDVPVEAPAEAGTDGASDASPDAGACNVPVAGCTADTTQKCDLFCQSGCGCHEKCSANTAGTLTCNTPLAARPRGLGETCDIAGQGQASQTDNCAPGLVCLNDACGSRCYRFCKVDADCPMSTCTVSVGGTVKACDVQATTCDPVKVAGQSMGCANDNEGCYLSASITDRTVCDCPFLAQGANASCSISRDCFPGLACIGPTGSSVCRPVCNLGAATSDCGPNSTCTKLNGSNKFGYCN